MATTIDELIKRVRGIPKAMQEAAYPALNVAVKAALDTTINAGQQPDGQPWVPRKNGSGPVLVNASNAVTVTTVASVIYIRLHGIEVKHHNGWVRGGVLRQIIPRKLTLPVATAIHRVMSAAFDQATSNG